MTAQRAMKAGANRRGLMLARRWRAQLAEQATPRRQALAGLALLALLAWPALHQYLQASMWRHMLLQYLLWMAAGALLAPAIPPRMRGAIARCNAHGLSGLVFTAVVLAVLMVPRVLDLALREPAIDLAKCAALVLAGSALRLCTALRIARATASAASTPSSVRSGAPPPGLPVASANSVSPSLPVSGSIARDRPWCASEASWLACALVSRASVATTPMVVALPAARAAASARAVASSAAVRA
jgi:hypothetical protein